MKNKAFALIVAIFVVMVFSVLGAVMVSLLSGESISITNDIRGLQALNIAEAGIRYVVASSIIPDPDWSNNSDVSKNFGAGSFAVTYLQKSKTHVLLESRGTVAGVTRAVQASVDMTGASPTSFGFGIFAGNQGGGPLIVQNSATVNGDFYYNGDVTMRNSAKLINGTLISKSLTLQNSATCASWEPLPVPPIEPPTFEPSYYDTVLGETTKSATSALSLTGTQVLNLNGETRYYTGITISNSARVNGPGVLVATTGNLVIQNSAIIGGNIRFIVKGTSTFSNSVSVGNTTEVFSQGNVTIQNGQDFPMDSLLFTHGNILFNNSSYYYGVIIAPDGDLTSSNSTKFRGLIYADSIDLQNSTNLRGSVIVDSVGYFSNSAIVTYDPAVLPAAWPIGFQGSGFYGITVSNWREVY